jgi:hypothetical protein
MLESKKKKKKKKKKKPKQKVKKKRHATQTSSWRIPTMTLSQSDAMIAAMIVPMPGKKMFTMNQSSPSLPRTLGARLLFIVETTLPMMQKKKKKKRDTEEWWLRAYINLYGGPFPGHS